MRGAVANGEVVPNGAHVNGSAVVNGTAVNGTAVNGTAVNGVAMNGTAVNGVAVSGVAVNGAVVYKSLHEDDHEALLETDPVALLEQQVRTGGGTRYGCLSIVHVASHTGDITVLHLPAPHTSCTTTVSHHKC